jgi:CBS domain-containing protein
MRRLSDIVCNQSPLILPETTTVKDACARMSDAKVGSILVTGAKGQLVGIFTGRDAVRRVLAKGKGGDTALKEVMTKTPVTMAPGKTAIDALRLMWSGGFRHIPLVEGEKVLGVISRGDFRSDESLTLDEELQLWENMR